MKKNKPMRAAGVLLLATMLTTCMTAGTFAKYTTSDSAEDSARVAKFGVVVSADGTLFGQQYQDSANGNKIMTYTSTDTTGTVQVSTSTDGNVVAPGTKNDTGLGFSVTGQPEVDVNVTSTIETENIYLTKGTYGVMVKTDNVTSVNFKADTYYVEEDGVYTLATAYSADDTYYVLNDKVELTTNYYPVVYTLTGDTDSTNDTDGTYTSDSLAEIAETLKTQLGTDGTKTVQANTSLAEELDLGSEVLTWEWAYERLNDDDEVIEMYDGADTILGDLASASDTTFTGTVVKLQEDDSYEAPAEDTDYNLETSFNMSITVTQID